MTRTDRRRHTCFIVTLAVLVGMLFGPAPASASVQWSANAERPWNQEWANYSCENGSRVQQVASPAAQGKHAYKIELRDGDDSWGERCELGNGNPTRNGFPLFHEGDERWISFQVYLPDDYPIDARSWNVFFQQKQLGSMGTPVISMEVQRGRFILMNSNNNGVSGDTVEQWNGPATRNRWIRFTVHTKFSPDDNVGSIELFGDLDGEGMKLLMPARHTHTMKQDGGKAVPVHARIGMYRDPSINGTSHILFDGYTIATDRASAEAGATALPQPPVVDPPAPSGNTPDPGAGAPKPPSRPAPKKHRGRVVLRTRRPTGPVIRTSGLWPQVLPVYGWVKGKRNTAR
jgi:polysaccharide lyase-like protein